MTALAACLSWSTEISARSSVERMLRAQAMFGPDGTSVNGSGDVALGRNLLRLLPEDVLDRQPVGFAGGRYQLVADLRLDNRDDLHDALGLSALEARLLSDAALLAQAFERWGIEETLPKLVGVFAIAVWDRHDKTLSLVRDVSSYRPLYYVRNSRFIAVSSMLKGLFALPDVPRELNDTWLAEYVSLLPHRGTSTFFRAIARVVPGCLVRLSQTGEEIIRWCDLSSVAERRPGSFGETLEELDALMQKSVRAQMRSTGAVASHLSGGLDSGVITALSAKMLAENGKTLHAYTAAPRDPLGLPSAVRAVANEAPQASRIAAMFPNIDHQIVFNDANPVTEVTARYIKTMDEIPLNPTNLVWMDEIQRRARADGASTILNGVRGNPTFSAGFELTRLEFQHRRSRLSYLIRIAGLARTGDMSPRRATALTLQSTLPEPIFRALQSWVSRAPKVPSGIVFLKDDVVSALDLTARVEQRYTTPEHGAEIIRHTRAFLLQQRDHGSLIKTGQALNGVDERDVCSDLRIIEFCLSLPVEMFSQGRDRAFAKALYRRHTSAEGVAGFVKGRQAAESGKTLGAERDAITSEIIRATTDSPIFRQVTREQLLSALGDTAVPGPKPVSHAQNILYSRLLGACQFVNHVTGRNSG